MRQVFCTYFFMDGFSYVSVFVRLAAHQVSLLQNEIGRFISRSQIAHEFANLPQAVSEPHGVTYVVALEKIADTSGCMLADLAGPVAHVGSHKECLAQLQRWRNLARFVILSNQLLKRHFLERV